MRKTFTLLAFYCFFIPQHLFASPSYSSLPTASATIFLDFDGHTVTTSIWNGGKPLDCAQSGLSDLQITEIFNRVSEDYRPFNVNITTDSAVFLAAPLTNRIRMIITTTSSWYSGVGGVAYTGSFTWGDDTPAFIFSDRLGPFNTKMVAECCSHESGHTVGLSHQSKYDGECALTSTYNDGNGTGETGWAPIMGNSYYRNRTGWNNGPTPKGCSYVQDNLSIITTANGFTYRVDDHGNELENPTPLTTKGNAFSADGIITTTDDKDAFEIIVPQSGALHLDAIPFSVGKDGNGADLDIKLTLLNALKQPINTYDPVELLDIMIDTTLSAGTYFIVIDGTGNSFSSDYGSLGSYSIKGTITPLGFASVVNTTLSGKVENNRHNLQWNITANERLNELTLETSTDGNRFEKLTYMPSIAKNFVYGPFIKANIFYRLKVVSQSGQTVFSNVVMLKSDGIPRTQFEITTFLHGEVLINAAANFKFIIADISGRVLQTGKKSKGISRISLFNYPTGMYVLQAVSKNERISERILIQ